MSAVSDLNFMLSNLWQLKQQNPDEYYRRAKDPVYQRSLQDAFFAAQSAYLSNNFLDNGVNGGVDIGFLPILRECIGIDLTSLTKSNPAASLTVEYDGYLPTGKPIPHTTDVPQITPESGQNTWLIIVIALAVLLIFRR